MSRLGKKIYPEDTYVDNLLRDADDKIKAIIDSASIDFQQIYEEASSINKTEIREQAIVSDRKNRVLKDSEVTASKVGGSKNKRNFSISSIVSSQSLMHKEDKSEDDDEEIKFTFESEDKLIPSKIQASILTLNKQITEFQQKYSKAADAIHKVAALRNKISELELENVELNEALEEVKKSADQIEIKKGKRVAAPRRNVVSELRRALYMNGEEGISMDTKIRQGQYLKVLYDWIESRFPLKEDIKQIEVNRVLMI
jgi:hypothetical protein